MTGINLSKIPTKAPKHQDKEATKKETADLIKRFAELQNLMYAESKHSLLIILQGMDASGKDGVIKEVFRGVNPMGCYVKSWKKPSDEEMRHEFLWRVHKEVPPKGMIHIFNRSHYEDVLVQRVHKWVDEETIFRRFDHINNFERLLQENDTHILKFYLHVSREEQLSRLEERLSDPKKMWKYNPNDLQESERWDEYLAAYQDVISRCSPDIPWTVVPADQNWFKEYTVAKTIVNLLESLRMSYPRHSE